MDNLKDKSEIIIALTGAACGYLFGGLDMLIQVFAIILIVDTISGMIKSYLNGTYESKLFRKGLWKKSGYMLAVILAVQLDKLMGDTGALRSALLFCFIANEGTSIIENLGEMGVPIPDTIMNAIAVLKSRGESNKQHISK